MSRFFLQKESGEKSRLHIIIGVVVSAPGLLRGAAPEPAARSLGRPPGLLHREVKRRLLRYSKVGERILAAPADQNRFLEQRGASSRQGHAAASVLLQRRFDISFWQGIAESIIPTDHGSDQISQAGFAAIAVCEKASVAGSLAVDGLSPESDGRSAVRISLVVARFLQKSSNPGRTGFSSHRKGWHKRREIFNFLRSAALLTWALTCSLVLPRSVRQENITRALWFGAADLRALVMVCIHPGYGLVPFVTPCLLLICNIQTKASNYGK